MLHTKFRKISARWLRRRIFLKVLTIYGRGSHLGHVTQIPDSMTTLGQHSFSVVDSVGPTLETDVGPT